ncbi:hypothetical protein BWH99_RS10660 [Vibrio parahaemolyticus]|uniref:hypothetical protein n=1 Tax=Vibrio parahaemolyticus TaxID=670 RepID=UPI001DC5ECE9|nr:hypothetical protein [Vibrio parahaemolyticus]EHU6487751.1 hypothetical protein [Vibrio parahaemolyticus]EIA9327138.1 hypothetical protein [Vibrio parahaemolyticus]EJG1681395.1 hypothetical protein [Vibrio parahaemolyticus]MEA5230132.1 hypothetical protein [Vibrio parahaemolyticus]
MNITEVLSYYTCDASKLAIDASYREEIEDALNVPTKPKVTTEDEYVAAMGIKRLLCRIEVYMGNISHPLHSIFSDLENTYSKALSRYNNSLLVKNKDDRRLIKYLAWTKYFTSSVDHEQMLIEAAQKGLLKKRLTVSDDGKTHVSLFVWGLKFKVGNNVFSVDRLGREHRTYLETIGRQCIPTCVPSECFNRFVQNNPKLIEQIADVTENDYVTDVGDGKYKIRSIPFSVADQNDIYYAYQLKRTTNLAA